MNIVDTVSIILSFEGILPRHSTVNKAFYLAGKLMEDVWHKWMDTNYPLWNKTLETLTWEYLLNRARIFHPDAFYYIKRLNLRTADFGIILRIIDSCNSDKRTGETYPYIINKHDIEWAKDNLHSTLPVGSVIFLELYPEKLQHWLSRFHVLDITQSQAYRLARCLSTKTPIPDNIMKSSYFWQDTIDGIFYKHWRGCDYRFWEDLYIKVDVQNKHILIDLDSEMRDSMYYEYKDNISQLEGCTYSGIERRFSFEDSDEDRYCDTVLRLHYFFEKFILNKYPIETIYSIIKEEFHV